MQNFRLFSRFRLVLALGVLLALVFSLQFPIYAQVTFTVDDLATDSHDSAAGDGTCSDGSAAPSCTLRAALEEANALAGADTINFSATGTLALSNAPTFGQLYANQDVTISATTGGSVIIDGGNLTRVFLVGDPGGVVTPNVTVTNIGFIRGNGLGNVAGAPRNEGGCIFVAAGATLTMNGSVVRLCRATGSKGGGIYGDGGIGGASPSTVNLYNSTTVRNNNASDGAGVYSLTGTIRVQSEACIRNNTATLSGGGIYGGDDTNVIVGGGSTSNRGIILGNTAASGGGIHLFLNAGFAGNHARFYDNNSGLDTGGAWEAEGGTYGTFGAGRTCVNCCVVANSVTYTSTYYAVYQPENGNTSDWNGNWWGDNWGPLMFDLNPAQDRFPESGSNVSNGDGINGDGTGGAGTLSRILVGVTSYGDWATAPTGGWLTTTAGNVPSDCAASLCTTASSIGPNRTCPTPATCGLAW